MTAALLLAFFEPFFQGSCLDTNRPGIRDVLAKLTAEEEVYVSVAEEAFFNYVSNADDPSYLTFDKILSILKILLFHDGRSELGLLRVAALAHEKPRYAAEAINALAALALYYQSGGESMVPEEQLLERFEQYMENPEMFHNARECRNALKARAASSTTSTAN